MKIKPVILCGGEGTRLWPKSKNNQAKQFINFGGWNLFEKTLDRIKGKIFDYPIISTNSKYLKQVKYFLKKFKIKKYNIVLEPAKRNTAPAILRTALIKNNKFYVQAGAGVVADSKPEKEYVETVNKAKALMKAVD